MLTVKEAKPIAYQRLLDLIGYDEMKRIINLIGETYHTTKSSVYVTIAQFTHSAEEGDIPGDDFFEAEVSLETGEILYEKLYELKV